MAAFEAGVVLAITPNGTVTARSGSDRFPPEGATVTALQGRFVGSVLRVFGPVSRPYLAIRPRRALRPDEALTLIGAPLRGGG
jgi:rRNA processing protein Gar1